MIARLRQLFSRKFVQDTLVLQAGKIGMVGLSLISSVLVWRLMGPGPFGDFALAQSFLIIWQTFDFTGIGTSTGIRLALAIGARDESAILDLMAFYVKLSIAINLGIFVLIALLGGVVAGLLYSGSSGIGGLALGLAFAAVADGLYALVSIALQSRRSMRTLALMQNANQLALTVLLISAVLISPTPESLVIARIVHSYATLLLALIVYERRRADGPVGYPALRIVFQRARTVSPRQYWRFGVANAIDKNLAQLFIQLPIQLVGVFAGARAVGYLQLALSGITQASVFTSAIFENMQAVVPQAVGRRDYTGLRRNFTRVLLVLAVGGILFYGALALFSPFVIPPLLGAQWLPAIPPLVALAFYGAVNTVGGNFGPLYRAFGQMRGIILIKVLGLALVLPFGIILFQEMASSTFVLDHFWSVTRFIPAALVNGGTGALYGALLIDAVFLVTVLLTALVTLPEL
ncbi:MAG: oligosaccharide flippase family protein, partial [Anaerolineae bacterium]|nr:oligosaccharide flippase family protein [Anaerolineae bacterium]